MNPMHILTTTNDNYAKHLGVMLNSLLINLSTKPDIVVSIIVGELSEANKQNLQAIANKYQLTLDFLYVDRSVFNNFKEVSHLSVETYYRLAIPDLLDKKVQKVLYLDCDLIVNGDITELWETDIRKHILAAVEKPFLNKNRIEALKIPADSKYFNAGVLLINLDKWRKQQISAKVMDYIKAHPSRILYPSQDPLNAVLLKKWLVVNAKWNFTTSHYYNTYVKKRLKPITPVIIHFTGAKKPWNKGHPLQKEYFKYEKKTPWTPSQPQS